MTIWQRIRTLLAPERRATFKDTSGWFHDWLTGGSTTASGEAVSPSKALTLSGYFAAVRAVAEDVGKIPLILYRRQKGGAKRRAFEHPVYRLLHDAPNPDMTAMDFRSCMTAHACNWGNGYAEIVHNGAGEPTELWPLGPGKMSIERDANGKLFYIYRNGGAEVRFPQRKILHIRGLASDGIQGYSIAHLAREAIGLGLSEQRSGADFFSNSSTPAGILSVPQEPGKDKRDEFHRQWEERYGKDGKRGRTAILSGGITFTPLSMSNEDSQFIESRQLTIEEMARWLRVPPHIIGHLLRATFSNIEHLSIEYVTLCLLSWAIRWEQEIQRKLISGTDTTLFAEHLFDALLRGDTTTRYAAFATARQWGWSSANDVLRKENMNPIGPAGDIYMIPANMMNAERLLETETPNGMEPPNGGADAGPVATEKEGEGEEGKNGGSRMEMAPRLRDRITAGSQLRADDIVPETLNSVALCKQRLADGNGRAKTGGG